MQQQGQIAVLGVTGYAGAELARLLLRHPRLAGASPLFLGREGSARESLTAIHPQLAGLSPDQLCVEPFSWDLLASRGVKVLFLATPHEQSRKLAPEALSRGLRIVDLSGAWRLERFRKSCRLQVFRRRLPRRHESTIPERLRYARAAPRRNRQSATGGQSRLLCDVHHPRA